MHYDTHQIMDYLSCYLPEKKRKYQTNDKMSFY